MKGKNKKKRALKISLIAMSFVLVMVLGVSLTLAWFYDGDWASNYVQMGGPVGIKIRDSAGTLTSGSNKLHFNLNDGGRLAYPGQSINIQAGVYNEGESKSILKDDGAGGTTIETTTVGSSCYVRAHFAVYTNIGKIYDAENEEWVDSSDKGTFDASKLCEFVQGLINEQNAKFGSGEGKNDYYWYYHQETGSKPLSTSGTGVGSDGSTSDVLYYLDGVSSSTANSTAKDLGYYYLCGNKAGETTYTIASAANNAYLKPLPFGTSNAFLWESSIVIPWQLTNTSASSYIIVEVIFQAVQTFIPNIGSSGATLGVIDKSPTNQVNDPTVGNSSVQTLFSSCQFSNAGDTGKILVDDKGTPATTDDWYIQYKNASTGEANADLGFIKATKATVDVASGA